MRPLLMDLVRPRQKLLALGFLLTIIGQVCSMVLPMSSRYFIDNVITKRQTWLLEPLILAVLGATLIQASTSFALSQLLSKAAQRLIAEMRRRVQEHVGRLSVTYYDANKSRLLVSRIMNDVEGLRNLVGTGLVDFVGGILKAFLALGVLMFISPVLTCMALVFIVAFAGGLSQAFKRIRPIFRERGKITAEVSGRLTESLSGVRVVKGYHAEAEEAKVFSGGVERLLDNVLRSITAISIMSTSATTLMGFVGAGVLYPGLAADSGRQTESGRPLPSSFLLWIPGCADVPGGRCGNADYRGAGGARPHAGDPAREARRRVPAAHKDGRRDCG